MEWDFGIVFFKNFINTGKNIGYFAPCTGKNIGYFTPCTGKNIGYFTPCTGNNIGCFTLFTAKGAKGLRKARKNMRLRVILN